MHIIIEDLKNHIQLTITALKKELASLRTNRPSPALVEDIPVVYYEKKLTVKQLGSISIVPPREIDIHVWDKEALNSIVKAIEASERGFSVQFEDNLIRIYLPELSEERRKELVKKVKEIVEGYRIRVRHFRDEANKRLQQSFDKNEISEDMKFKLKEEVQKEVDKINKEIEQILENKIREINEK